MYSKTHIDVWASHRGSQPRWDWTQTPGRVEVTEDTYGVSYSHPELGCSRTYPRKTFATLGAFLAEHGMSLMNVDWAPPA